MSAVELQELIRTDPEWREAAWGELRFRNQARQAFERENERPYLADYITSPATLWLPLDLSTPAPLSEGPLTEC